MFRNNDRREERRESRRDDPRDDRRDTRDRRDDRRDEPEERRDSRRDERDFDRRNDRPDDDRDRERRVERRTDSREQRRDDRIDEDMDTFSDRRKDERYDERRETRGRERKGKVEAVVPMESIEWEVIEADIQLYLGPGATVEVGNHPKTNRPCYWCTGFHTLTEAMLSDLKADSDRWLKEKQYSPNLAYKSSTTHHGRQRQGPTRKLHNPPAPTPRQRAARTQSPEPLLTYADAERMIAQALKDKGQRGVSKGQLERLIEEALRKDREKKTGQDLEQPRAANQGRLVAQVPPKYPQPDPDNPDHTGPYGGRR